MKITPLLAIALYLMFGIFAVKAQNTTIKSINNLSTTDGPEFHAENKGLVLSTSFPSSVKEIDSLVVTLKLINSTGSTLVFRFDNALRGFDFHLINDSQQEVTITNLHKQLREGGLGFETLNLKPGSAMVTTVPLSHLYAITKMGKYTLKVIWRDLKIGDVGYVPDPAPKIRLEGAILLQKSNNGISISVAH